MKQYLHLTPHQFDQDISGGWRFLCNQGLVDYVSSDKKDHLGISNIDTMQRMMEFWGSSYLEAYSGMELNLLKEYLLSHK